MVVLKVSWCGIMKVRSKAVRDAERMERYAGYPTAGGGVYHPPEK